MPGILYFALYLLCGLCIVRWLLPRHTVLTRVWLGSALGLLLMMWLPALMAFFFRFSVKGHLLALLPLALLTGGAYLLRSKQPARGWDVPEARLGWQMLAVVVPLTALSAWLQYTHCVRVGSDGSWWVGQSTYGDLAMHMSFVTSLKDAAFPPEYALFPGQQLSYPFLTDSLSTTFYLFGCSLQVSLVLPGTLMMALCYMGVMCLAREMTSGGKAIVLAALLFFLNGGLGFVYAFDMAGGTDGNGTPNLWHSIEAILNGYYKTPTNQPDVYNLQWSNVIADLMVPQRTLLGGWCMVLPCFYLLWTSFAPGNEHRVQNTRALVMLGVWGGALPLIHTHSFTALALCSLGMLVYDMIHEEDRLGQFRRYALYGLLAAALSLPQLFGFTFNQVFQQDMAGKSNSFLEFWFNWRNTAYTSTELQGTAAGMRDLYGWFYLKNIGLPFLLLIFALFERNRRWRRIFAGALPILLAAEFIRFQPNIYDNNKLLYLAWLLCAMIVADFCRMAWQRMKGLRARPFIAIITAMTFFLSAGLTLWRESVSNYQAFSANAVEVGEYVRDNTEQDATFLTGVHHLNPVASIAGRKIVCGPDLWLYYHGLDTTERKADIRAFYADPAENREVLEKYGVDYIMVSSYERADYAINMEALDEMFPRVYSNGEATIWRVTEDE